MNYADAALEALERHSPGLDPGLRQLYALLALTRGKNTTLADVHDAWSLWRTATNPDHTSIVVFDELERAVQNLDAPFRDAIAQAAREL